MLLYVTSIFIYAFCLSVVNGNLTDESPLNLNISLMRNSVVLLHGFTNETNKDFSHGDNTTHAYLNNIINESTNHNIREELFGEERLEKDVSNTTSINVINSMVAKKRDTGNFLIFYIS
jgi:hypothetical protein